MIFVCCLNCRLDVYIHDYLVKRDLKASAQAFQAEGKVSSDPVGKMFCIEEKKLLRSYWFSTTFKCCACWISAIDAPGGFLFEWWSVFWDIFIARTNEKHSEVAASYIEVGFGPICFYIIDFKSILVGINA